MSRSPLLRTAPARLFAVAVLVAAQAVAPQAIAAPVVLRARGAPIDEAVQAFKAELGAPVVELPVDDTTTAAAIAPKLASAGATLVVAVGARAAQVALQQPSIPFVHCMVLQDAGAFDTDRSAGVPLTVPFKAQLAALQRVAPSVKKVGVVYDPKLSARQIEGAASAARALGLILVSRPVTCSADVPSAVDKLLPEVSALLVVPDATVVTKDLVSFVLGRSFERRVPVLAYSESVVKIGALAALAPDYAQNGRLCARLARRVLSGENPGQLHDAVPMTGTLVVNAATAQRIGVGLSAAVLQAPTVVVGR